jgi:quinoprotein glucose dehydrogenase
MSAAHAPRRSTALALIVGLALVTAAVTLPIGMLDAQQPTLVRGNAPGEWRYWGADAWSTRYSPLDQINASNFNQLQVAWRWNAAEDGEDEYYRATPLFANGRLFTVATNRRYAYAIDPATGQTLWKWNTLNEGIRWQKAPRRFAGRGLAYWTDGQGNERIIVVTPGYHMAILDAKTGVPDPAVGKNGIVDLMEGLGLPLVPLAVDNTDPMEYSDLNLARRARPGERWDEATQTGADGTVGLDPELGQVAASCPPIVVGDVVVVGSSHIHGYYPTKLRNLPGWIRGFDIKTGRQLWKFNLVPQPGEFGADTWKNGSTIGTPGMGKNDAWATYSADPELGLVYIPVGMPLSDEYGGHRHGNNLFGNSIVALDVKTGQRRWHFQMVHHDIWDYDTPMAPNLMDVTIDGRPRRIIIQPTKQGWLYVFDRVTGEPIWPIVETPVIQSEVPGEQTSPTQPIPTKPAPYAQQGLEEEDLIDYTPEIKAAALHLAQKCQMGPYYIPPSAMDGTTKFPCSWYAPGASGGVNIDGGATIDPETGFIYVASQAGLSTTEIVKDPCSEHRYVQGPRNTCGRVGAMPPPPGYVPPARGGGGGGRGGGGGGGRAGRGGGGGGAAAALPSYREAEPGTSTLAGGRGRGSGVSIVKPRQLGGITAYNMSTGDKAWWIANGGLYTPTPNPDSPDAALFKDVQLLPQSSGGQAQAITTKTLMIYGTGRSGGAPGAPPRLFAVDKATGREVGVVEIPSKTSAVPMTFLHNGRQYIVFAIGSGRNTALLALALPR